MQVFVILCDLLHNLTMSNRERFFLTSPHSGEKVPDDIYWLKNQNEVTLMFDVDRYVDQLYEEVAANLNITLIKSYWHRYFSDANRLPSDVDQGSVEGAEHPKGKFMTGLIWQTTSQGHTLLEKPITNELYQHIVTNYYQDFHTEVLKNYEDYFKVSGDPVYQLDLHSMPSKGTRIHRDPGELRAEIVVSDQNGQSASKAYVELIKVAYEKAGFKVAYNWPYIGGRVTETYGQPSKSQHCVQVELRRDLYMDESLKQKNHDKFDAIKQQLAKAITYVYENLDDI
jgi:N-formylglutamate amidohydrolase